MDSLIQTLQSKVGSISKLITSQWLVVRKTVLQSVPKDKFTSLLIAAGTGLVVGFVISTGCVLCCGYAIKAKNNRKNNNNNVRSTAASGRAGHAVYESNRAVDEYLHFHYATRHELVPFSCAPTDALDFCGRCARKCSSYVIRRGQVLRALDLGCAVGRASFELTKYFDEVVGIDFSNAFVETANEMKANRQKPYSVMVEGEIKENLVAKLPSEVQPARVTFQRGDACNLDESIGSFDAVLGANLLCRLPDPAAFLRRLSTLVKPGGIAVLVSPYSWLDEYTAKSKWIGGFVDKTNKPHDSFQGIKDVLGADFEFVGEEEMSFLIREHKRKYQWGCSHCTVWRRKFPEGTASRPLSWSSPSTISSYGTASSPLSSPSRPGSVPSATNNSGVASPSSASVRSPSATSPQQQQQPASRNVYAV